MHAFEISANRGAWRNGASCICCFVHCSLERCRVQRPLFQACRCWHCICISECAMRLKCFQPSSGVSPMLKHCVSRYNWPLPPFICYLHCHCRHHCPLCSIILLLQNPFSSITIYLNCPLNLNFSLKKLVSPLASWTSSFGRRPVPSNVFKHNSRG